MNYVLLLLGTLVLSVNSGFALYGKFTSSMITDLQALSSTTNCGTIIFVVDPLTVSDITDMIDDADTLLITPISIVVYPSYGAILTHTPQQVVPLEFLNNAKISKIYVSNAFTGWKTEDLVWNQNYLKGITNTIAAYGKTAGVLITTAEAYTAAFGAYSGLSALPLNLFRPYSTATLGNGHTVVGGWATPFVQEYGILEDYLNGTMAFKLSC